MSTERNYLDLLPEKFKDEALIIKLKDDFDEINDQIDFSVSVIVIGGKVENLPDIDDNENS